MDYSKMITDLVQYDLSVRLSLISEMTSWNDLFVNCAVSSESNPDSCCRFEKHLLPSRTLHCLSFLNDHIFSFAHRGTCFMYGCLQGWTLMKWLVLGSRVSSEYVTRGLVRPRTRHTNPRTA